MNETKEINMLKEMQEKMSKVNEYWEHIGLNEPESIEKYPFNRSFDEVLAGVIAWVRNIENNR